MNHTGLKLLHAAATTGLNTQNLANNDRVWVGALKNRGLLMEASAWEAQVTEEVAFGLNVN